MNINFPKNSFNGTIRVSNSLDPDQARHFVCPDLGPNCLQRLSTEDIVRASKERDYISCFCCPQLTFLKINFIKRLCVPDLVHSLQRLSADDKSHC